MRWLGLGVLYTVAYAAVGWTLADQSAALSWFRAIALLIPPMTGTAIIFRRRHEWAGCHWLFWATIAIGLAMSAVGLTGWAVDELVFNHMTWLAWPAIFALFGSVAPLFALLAQPHRGAREPLAATTAVDIAGLAVVTGFLYSFFVTSAGPDARSPSLEIVSELQQIVVFFAMLAGLKAALHTPWAATYRRLALGGLVSFVALTLSNIEANRVEYRSGFVYDFVWILPFAFFAWAASTAPASELEQSQSDDDELSRPRPWVIFTAVALLPFLDFGLRQVIPQEETASGFRDLSTAVAIISVLPLLVARIAAERAELERAGGTMRLLAQVIEQAQDHIVVFTPNGRCRHANQAFRTATGLSEEQAQGLRDLDIMSGAEVPASDIQSIVTGGGSWRGTLSRQRADGSSFPVSATIAALVDDRGKTTHIVSAERDISEEQRLRQQLIHSERLSAVGQLVAGVAHELNNPLQAVLGFSELLMQGDVTPTVRADLDLIQRNSQRAAAIVRQLLTFARQSSPQRTCADLREIVRSSVALRKAELRTTDIELDERYDEHVDGLTSVWVNEEEIRQIVVNLLLNAEQAIHSTDLPGRISVRVGADQRVAFAEVADDGPGVPAAIAERIFEPFFTTKPVGQGTGLGLSVSFGIAQAHGGSLALRRLPRGCCFRLTLPSHRATAAVDGRAPQTMPETARTA